MKAAYRPLFQVRIRHSFYADGRSTKDFSTIPSPATARKLKQFGLIFRPASDGFAIYVEIEPESDPPVLKTDPGNDALRLTFLLHNINPYLGNVSNLPDYRPGREVFYFSNLRDDQENGRLHLGDSVAGARVGSAVALIADALLTYRFGAPVESAVLTITDIFGGTVHRQEIRSSEPGTPIDEYRLDLSQIDRLPPGRYLVTDDHGGSSAIYFAGDVGTARPFGIVEIFNSTTTLTPDESEWVPVDYRFLVQDRVIDIGPYHMQFESRATTWRYSFIKKYESNSVTLDGLAITGGIGFSKTIQPDRAVFVSNSAVSLRQTAQALTLEHSGAKVRDLPNPRQVTPLQEGAGAGSYVSEMFINV